MLNRKIGAPPDRFDIHLDLCEDTFLQIAEMFASKQSGMPTTHYGE